LLEWLNQHDPGYVALRRASRAALIMPASFALGAKVIGNPTIAIFASFGGFAMLLLVDFGGTMRLRLQNQAALALGGAVLIALATLASQTAWSAALAMAVVGFAVLFAGVVSSVLASATTSLLLAFILPVALSRPISSIPDELAGWGIAAGASLVAVALLWPSPPRSPFRGAVAAACAACAERLRADVAYLTGGMSPSSKADQEAAAARARASVEALRRSFFATAYRPTGLTTEQRVIVRIVDELLWLHAILAHFVPHHSALPVNSPVCKVKGQAASLLELGAQLLGSPGANINPQAARDELGSALDGLSAALDEVERTVTVELPLRQASSVASPGATERGDVAVPGAGQSRELISSLDPSFRAQELTFAVTQIASNIALVSAAEQRSWVERLLGHQPAGLSGPLASARERASSHLERHSVWLHNSVRGAIGLGLAVLVARLTGVQHAFWVVLGSLSVLRSNALSTGQNVLRSIGGTVAGFVIGAALLEAIGTNLTVLWFLLPLAVLCAGFAPAAISFAAGQSAFTILLVILFNIVQPAGWRVGLLRIEDIALGCAVSLVVGLLFWPRGAAAALGDALAEAYGDSARYLAGAVRFAVGGGAVALAAPADEQVRAAAAARRLDDAFRGFLAERGPKRVPLAEVTALVTGVVGLRLAGDAVVDLWSSEHASQSCDSAIAREELLATATALTGWYEHLGASLVGRAEVPAALAGDASSGRRLVDAVRDELQGADGMACGAAVRMIWTGDHLDAARRLQDILVEPARAVSTKAALSPQPATRLDRALR
jgi:uncharacterized membrane protein YccC